MKQTLIIDQPDIQVCRIGYNVMITKDKNVEVILTAAIQELIDDLVALKICQGFSVG